MSIHHLVAAAHEYGHRTCVGALLDDQHLVPGGTECDFADDTCLAELLCSKVLEARHNTTVGCNSNQLEEIDQRMPRRIDAVTYLDFRTTDPPHSR